MSGGTPCGPCRWGLRWGSLWGHEPCEGVPEWAQWAHANAAIWALSGAPYGAAKRVRGVPKQRHAESKGKDEEEGGGGGAAGGGGERGALSLQNEDPTPQDGWEKNNKQGAPHLNYKKGWLTAPHEDEYICPEDDDDEGWVWGG